VSQPPTATIRIFQSELDQILNAVIQSPDLETGGELLGLWSHADSPTVMLAGVTVLLAGTPAPGSRRGTTWFEQDAQTHMALERLSWERYGVQVVGLWHSHHQLSLHTLSQGDVHRTQGYSVRHQRPRYSEILAFLVERESSRARGLPRRQFDVGLRPYVYENAATGQALGTRLEVLPGWSPLRDALQQERLDRALEQVIDGPRRRRSGIGYFVTEHPPPPRVPREPPPPAERAAPVAEHAVAAPAAQPAAAPEPDAEPAEHGVPTVAPATAAASGDLPVSVPRPAAPYEQSEQADASDSQPPPGTEPDEAPAHDEEREWPMDLLTSALAELPPTVSSRVSLAPAPAGHLELRLPAAAGVRAFVIEMKGDSRKEGRVTAYITAPYDERDYIADDRKARKVEFATLLAEGLERLEHRRGR
jgi:hypothetical protein